MEAPKELHEHLVKNNWDYDPKFGRYSAGNLLVYFRHEFRQWRLKDRSVFSNMDITSIIFPFDDIAKGSFQRMCSMFYKDPTNYTYLY